MFTKEERFLCSAKIVYFLTTPNGVHSQNRKTGA